MGNQEINYDFINAITDVIDDIGGTLTLNYSTEGSLTPGNPGAGRTKTLSSKSIQGILTEYEDKYIDGSVIKKGDRLAILSIACLTIEITQGMFIVDNGRTYKIINVEKPQVSGSAVTVLAQVRG